MFAPAPRGLEGERRLLGKLLERRFGPLPQVATDRLAAASEAQLDAWSEAELSAPSDWNSSTR